MKSTAQQKQDEPYELKYAAAPWVDPGESIGFFATINTGKNDTIVTEFKQGADGVDRFDIYITPGDDSTPVHHYIHEFPLLVGSHESGCSSRLVLTIADATGHGPTITQTLPYGQNSYDPTPEPLSPYLLTYLSGPYARFSGRRTAEDEVYLIIGMYVLENDLVEGVFTTGAQGESYDTFELKITSPDTGAEKLFCHIFGPYSLTNPDTVTVMVSSSVNGKPAQKPVGIKSYGNDCRFF